VFTIGIDPHKGSHTAAVLDRTETVIDELRVTADAGQREPRSLDIETSAARFGRRVATSDVDASRSGPIAHQRPRPSTRR
jgi:hypothetical protein